MSSVLEAIKSLLATHGRVALDSPRNDPVAFPEGAYTDLEHNLMRLGLLTEIIPIAVTTAVAEAEAEAAAAAAAEAMAVDAEKRRVA